MAAYVPPTGSECNITVPSQYSTIQAALDVAAEGNTICVSSGIYNENLRINKSIRLSGRGAAQSIINGQITEEDPGLYTVFVNASNVTVEGFLIKGTGSIYAYTASVLFHPDPISGTIIRYNWIVAGDGSFALRGDNNQANQLTHNNVLEGNNSPYIAFSGYGENVDFLNNTFIGTVSSPPALGVVLFDVASNNSILQNAFEVTGAVGVIVMSSSTSIVSQNNLNSNTQLKVYNYTSDGILNAENNWWGDTDPSDNIYGNIDYTPYAIAPFPEYPAELPNAAPLIGAVTAPTSPIQVNTAIAVTADFTDVDVLDTHTAIWDWGDGNTTAGTVTENNGSGSVSDSHVYTTTGVYTITLTVTDNDGATGTSVFQYVSVYNPTPQGLFSGSRTFQDPAIGGKVMFGISVKYQGDNPVGNVSMNFKSVNLDFTASSINLFVVSGGKATLRGSGTVNGVSGYTFLVTGIDSTQMGGQTVRFQIKDASNAVVYDSQPGASDSADPITSVIGRILVHE